ncbi:hypothetical protein BDK51DRAFT_49840 [Blyttiomyces helicus]|uniref:Uncharacterized protein n=1 Tax=Blyttiomyces helicus TaxID=388810 RepID=A0A4P9VWM0_9FUNG|nr:hypothetical protein BDK51DRAFT_49840 [Blyttiomyces helicus]|eukprot:RKO84094.1 hypothetical protein BDK51DRAFT_49840 [Blyttiomyces helicus]
MSAGSFGRWSRSWSASYRNQTPLTAGNQEGAEDHGAVGADISNLILKHQPPETACNTPTSLTQCIHNVPVLSLAPIPTLPVSTIMLERDRDRVIWSKLLAPPLRPNNDPLGRAFEDVSERRSMADKARSRFSMGFRGRGFARNCCELTKYGNAAAPARNAPLPHDSSQTQPASSTADIPHARPTSSFLPPRRRRAHTPQNKFPQATITRFRLPASWSHRHVLRALAPKLEPSLEGTEDHGAVGADNSSSPSGALSPAGARQDKASGGGGPSVGLDDRRWDPTDGAGTAKKRLHHHTLPPHQASTPAKSPRLPRNTPHASRSLRSSRSPSSQLFSSITTLERDRERVQVAQDAARTRRRPDGGFHCRGCFVKKVVGR